MHIRLTDFMRSRGHNGDLILYICNNIERDFRIVDIRRICNHRNFRSVDTHKQIDKNESKRSQELAENNFKINFV